MGEKKSYYAFILLALAFCVLAFGKTGSGQFVFADIRNGSVTGANSFVKVAIIISGLLFILAGWLVVGGIIKKK